MDVLFGDVGFLPTQFREAIRVCKVDPKPVGNDFGKDWLKDKQTPYHSCNSEQALWPEDELLAARVLVGDPAKRAHDDLSAFNEPAPEQWADGDQEIYYLDYPSGGLPNVVAYYPNQQMMVVFLGIGGEENEQKAAARSGLEKLGFL